MSSTVERLWSGSSTVTKSHKTPTAASSMIRTVGLRIRAISSQAIERIVYVSVESARIIEGLPPILSEAGFSEF